MPTTTMASTRKGWDRRQSDEDQEEEDHECVFFVVVLEWLVSPVMWSPLLSTTVVMPVEMFRQVDSLDLGGHVHTELCGDGTHERGELTSLPDGAIPPAPKSPGRARRPSFGQSSASVRAPRCAAARSWAASRTVSGPKSSFVVAHPAGVTSDLTLCGIDAAFASPREGRFGALGASRPLPMSSEHDGCPARTLAREGQREPAEAEAEGQHDDRGTAEGGESQRARS